MGDSKKNVIILHMESINCEIMSKYAYCFENLNKFKSNMKFFNKYYSSATSTLMVISDLMFGETNTFEESNYLEDIFSIRTNKNSILKELSTLGYYTKSYIVSHPYNAFDSMNKLNSVINPTGELLYTDSLNAFEHSLNIDTSKNEKFAFFIADLVSHISYSNSRCSEKYSNICKRFEDRYMRLDKTIGIIFNTLINNNRLKDTIILLYGDHGEEYFFHDFHQGFTHAIEPLNYIIHCPFFIYCDGLDNIVSNELLSTIDIKTLIVNLIEGKNSVIKNKYVYSRNLFKNQVKLRYFLNKSYVLTDGNYIFIFSNRGVGLFCNLFDSGNSLNLLSFFNIRKNSIKFKNKFKYAISGHFVKLFSNKFIEEIIKVYINMSTELRNRLITLGVKDIDFSNNQKLYELKLSLIDNFVLFKKAAKHSIKNLFFN